MPCRSSLRARPARRCSRAMTTALSLSLVPAPSTTPSKSPPRQTLELAGECTVLRSALSFTLFPRPPNPGSETRNLDSGARWSMLRSSRRSCNSTRRRLLPWPLATRTHTLALKTREAWNGRGTKCVLCCSHSPFTNHASPAMHEGCIRHAVAANPRTQRRKQAEAHVTVAASRLAM